MCQPPSQTKLRAACSDLRTTAHPEGGCDGHNHDPDHDSSHDSYEHVAAARRSSADYREGYEEARRAFLIGQAVRERREALGLSQTEVAARAGMTQPALSRLEAGGSVPDHPCPGADRARPWRRTRCHPGASGSVNGF